MAAVTLVCYSLLMVINVPLPDPGHNMQHHVLGMWFSFLLGVGLILFFVVSMAEALRQRNKKLAEARERNLRDEHMVSLGTLAAGAAHELGTPLGTMAILTKEMEQEYRQQPGLVEKIEILRSQVDRCKTTLGQISASAGQMKAESGRSEDVKLYLQQCLARWKEMHPGTTIAVSLNGSDPTPVIVVDETLNQAIINVLNNASDASPEKIELKANWSHSELSLEIIDFGEGLSQATMEELGKPFFTTKKDGHGLGFYLAQAVVHRLGGEVKASNHKQGGACIHIRLPLNKLMAE
jgi:two-component system sensor histidine kinase RegB